MGFFSTKKTITVSSVVYNMAGDVDKRPDFLKTTVLGGVIGDNGLTVSETIQRSYIGGSGIKLRSFGRWARTSGYSDTVGQNASYLSFGNSLNRAVLSTHLPRGAGQIVSIQTAEIGSADYSYWADQYMADNHPALVAGSWMTNFDEVNNLIEVAYTSGGGTVTQTFTPVGFNPGAKYLYARYNLRNAAYYDPVVLGSVELLPIYSPHPSVAGMAQNNFVSTPTPITLNTYVHMVVSYSDARPTETTDTTSSIVSSYDETYSQWEKMVFMGLVPGSPDETYSIRMIANHWQTAIPMLVVGTPVDVVTDLGGGVTKTTTTTTSAETIRLVRSYRDDTQRVVSQNWSDMRVYIYQQNTGNSALDAMFNVPETGGAFLPFIPIRLNNTFLSGGMEALANRALRRGLNTSFSNLRDKINDTPNIRDIDYAYVVYGVSLNVKENSCRRYLYEFFQEIMLGRDLTGGDYAAWQVNWEAARTSWVAWKLWKTAQEDLSDLLYGTIEPIRLAYPEPPYYSVSVTSGGREGVNYNMLVSWNGIRESVNSGSAHSPGEVWIENLGQIPYNYDVYTDGETTSVANGMDRIKINWQQDADTVRSLEIWGLNHRNLIYGGKSVDISASQALSDASESGFIIPLHENIYKRMSLVDATQMSTACVFMVFNCYQIVKQKWYQTTWFKILLVIAVIVITVVTGGAGAGSVGLLGANAAVGASLGFTGVTAAIVGAVANAVAAMILVQIITRVSTAIFGDKIGAIIGAVASIVALQVGTSLMAGEGIFSGFESLLRAENLIKMSSSVGEAYSSYVKAETQDIMKQTSDTLRDYTAQSTEIAARSEALFGVGTGADFNPLSLTDVSKPMTLESPATFMARTLMTGGDIATLSMEVVNEYASLTLSNQLPGA